MLPILALIFLGGYLWSSKNQSTNSSSKTPKSSSTEAKESTKKNNDSDNSASQQLPSVKNDSHSRSIKSLIEKNYQGSNFKVGEILEKNPAYTRHYITYQSDGLTISGIMNVPIKKEEEPFPVLILNHGYINPNIYTNGRGLKREQDYLAQEGYLVIHPDYRGHAQSDPDPEIGSRQGLAYAGYTSDIINLVLALREADLDYADPERIGVLGHSMGGGVAMNALIARPNLFDAAILFAPVSSDYYKNFQRWAQDNLTSQETQQLEKEIGSLGNSENFRAFSSVTYFSRIDDPLMIHQGTGDKDVPAQWSRETHNELKKAGKNSTYHQYPNAPHEFIINWPQVMQRSLDFFDKHVKNNSDTSP